MKWIVALAVFTVLVQDKKPAVHNSEDPRKCKKCLPAYEKAMAYVRENLKKASYPAKMVAGWVLLADGRFSEELNLVVKEACAWKERRGTWPHNQNWYPALAAIFLMEYYRTHRAADVQAAIQSAIDEFVKVQERTGGWFKWFEGAYKDRLDYFVKDLGILDAMIFGLLHHAKTLGFKVPADTIARAEKCLFDILTDRGIGYGSVQKSGDITGARGAFAMLGLQAAGMTQHKIYTTYVTLLPKQIPNMDQGHHIGAFHCLGVTLGCRLLGPQAYGRLTGEWLDKLIAKQDEKGAVYVGDDGDAGGEEKLLGGNFGSTAAFALMILMQDAKILSREAKTKATPRSKK